MAKYKKKYSKKELKEKDKINEIKFCMRKKDWENAYVKINNYLSTYSTDYYVMILKAMVIYKLGKRDESRELFNEILSSDLSLRNELFARMQYAHILLDFDELDEAIEYYKSVIEKSNGLELVARGKLSGVYCRKQEYPNALEVLDINGYNDEYLNCKRAEVYMQMGHCNKALKIVNEKTYNTHHYEVKEKLDDAYIAQEKNFIIGLAYYNTNRIKLAQQYLSNVSNFNTKLYFEANIRLIKIYGMQGYIDEAIKLSDDMLKSCTSSYYINTFKELKAFAYLKKNDYKKAEEIFNNLELPDERKKIFLGKVELIKGNFYDAEEYFSGFDIEKEDINEKYDDFYKLALIKFRLGKYDEAEKIIDKFLENLQNERLTRTIFEVKRLKTYIDNARGNEISDDNLVYSEKQIIEYDEEEAIKHITDHHLDNPKVSKFYDDIDIRQLFNEIKDMLKRENAVYDSVLDKYIIKYQKIGFDLQNGNIHEIHVLTLPNTTNIITMYPYDGTESIINIEENEVKEKPKIKTLTGLERFNRRYGINT